MSADADLFTEAREEYRVDGLPAPLSHYTDAVRWRDLLFVSGCVSLGPDGKVVSPGDVTGQARLAHEYLGAALRAAGSDFAHVLKVTVFLRDAADRRAVNDVRKEFFGPSLPASTLIEVSSLAIDELLVEIEAIAGIPS
jgi:2-iminobutanoate/2-iminopropanoate deaminase